MRLAATLVALCCCLVSVLAVPAADRQHRRRPHARRSHARRGSGSSAASYAVQTCGTDNFYCRKKGGHDCDDRDLRCPVNPAHATCKTEHSCFPHQGGFGVYTVKVDMPGACIIKKPAKLLGQNYYHQAVLYRGFLYEYGSTYPLGQELDVMDPAYKYAGNAHGYTVSGRVASSTCTRRAVKAAMLAWTEPRSYKLFSNNCQDFAGYLVGVLADNCAQFA